LLGGDGGEAAELREQVDTLRRQREELPPPHLDQATAVQNLQKQAEVEVPQMEKERDEQLGILDKLIEKAREIAAEVKERVVATARKQASSLR